MRLKKIKPGMVIHCKNDEEKRLLLEEAERLGYRWIDSTRPTEDENSSGSTIHFNCSDEFVDYKYTTWSNHTKGATEFSDLILPELTAEEVLQIYNEICSSTPTCGYCPMAGNCFNDNDSDYSKVVEICQQWKSDHEKKEPEIETVDICRIIVVMPDGRKRCVHEEDIRPDTGMKSTEETENILKRYCMEHKGEFIAVHEVVSRVKR